MNKIKFYFNCILITAFFSFGLFAINVKGATVDCQKKPPTHPKQCAETLKQFKAAGELMLGIRQDEWIGTGFNGYFGSKIDSTIIYWTSEFANETDPKFAGKFLEGSRLQEVLGWMKTRMATDNSDGSVGRIMCFAALKNAFNDVYGGARYDNSDYEKYKSEIYKKNCAVYSTIRTDLQKKVNNSPSKRLEIINQAYLTAMGRDATGDEKNYWQKRAEDFLDIVYAARQYLYTPNGAKDLFETVKRAMQTLKITDVSDSAVKVTAEVFRKNKLIYSEMIQK